MGIIAILAGSAVHARGVPLMVRHLVLSRRALGAAACVRTSTSTAPETSATCGTAGALGCANANEEAASSARYAAVLAQFTLVLACFAWNAARRTVSTFVLARRALFAFSSALAVAAILFLALGAAKVAELAGRLARRVLVLKV
jgi:hypothetical protein